MMMLLPSVAPKDVDGAFAVLALLTNPEAAQKRLAELQAALDAANDRTAAAEKAGREIDAASARVDNENAKLLSARTQFDTMRVSFAQMAQERDERAAAQAAKLAERDAEITLRENVVAEEVERLGKLKKAIDRRSEQLVIDEAAAAAMRADYEDKLAKLRAISG